MDKTEVALQILMEILHQKDEAVTASFNIVFKGKQFAIPEKKYLNPIKITECYNEIYKRLNLDTPCQK